MTRARIIKSHADLTPREVDLCALAIHEAGHATACVLLSGHVRAVVASGDPDGDSPLRGNTLTDPASGTEPLIAYAGCWAEARWRVGRNPTQAEVVAVLSRNRCEGGTGDDQVLMAAGGVAAAAGVPGLLTRNWAGVCRLAGAVYRQGTARHADVLAALGLSDDAATRAVELSLLRSGAAPGTFRVAGR